MTRFVVALGDGALRRRGEPHGSAVQQRDIEAAAAAVASVVDGRSVVVTHGNGPQVGLLARQSEAMPEGGPYPLDMPGAESEGPIGDPIERALASRLPGRRLATLLTQMEVDPDDPSFRTPTWPIGPSHDAAVARRLAVERGWTVAPDGGGWRRVVPSPEPKRTLELPMIRHLLDAGGIVVCAGNIPVTVDRSGAIREVEAVVDQDLAAALLAIELNATRLLLLTGVPAVYLDWPRPARHAVRWAAPDALSATDFASRSMQPKIEAARRFAARTGGAATIGALEDLVAIIAGKAGTTIAAGAERLALYPPDREDLVTADGAGAG